MPRATLEVADIFRLAGEAYRQTHRWPLPVLKLMRAIEVCRTATLGGHVEACDHCGESRISYNSGRNRHCPKCGSLARARWLAQRKDERLPVEYFHVVFTIPAALHPLVYQNQALLYDQLFHVTRDVLTTIARDPKHLGAEIGCFGILHTWGQNLEYHPHLHYVIPGGGLSLDGNRWIACRPGFFLPVRVLSALFRRRFLDTLEQLHDQGQLQFFGNANPFRERAPFSPVTPTAPRPGLGRLCQAPFRRTHAGPRVSRPLHPSHRHLPRPPNRLPKRRLKCRPGHLSLEGLPPSPTAEIPDPLPPRVYSPLPLTCPPPPGFQRIRFAGFFANCHRRDKLALIRQLLTHPVAELLPLPSDTADLLARLTGIPAHQCPACGVGPMIVVEILAPIRWAPPVPDTS